MNWRRITGALAAAGATLILMAGCGSSSPTVRDKHREHVQQADGQWIWAYYLGLSNGQQLRVPVATYGRVSTGWIYSPPGDDDGPDWVEAPDPGPAPAPADDDGGDAGGDDDG